MTGGGRRRTAARRRDGGSASVELVVMIPLLLFGGLVAFQLGVAAWTATSASEAARQAARAATLSPSGNSQVAARNAAEDSLPSGLSVHP